MASHIDRAACPMMQAMRFFLCALLAVLPCMARSQEPAPSTAGTASLVARGLYLSRAGGCAACHSPPGVPAFAGGVQLNTPFGALYGPNITPDTATGIGSWTEADFRRALRAGVRKDGQPLYPAMPYENYTKISDADISALWAYLRSVPPARHQVPANTLRFPMNVRRGVALWQSAFFTSVRYAPAPDKDAVWNRGGYLVEALGHCGACHTPRNALQGLEKSRTLGGAQIDGWYAPALLPGLKLIDGPIEDLQAYLRTGRGPGNVKTFGPMQEVVSDGLSHLSEDDIHAIAVYLRDPRGAPQPARDDAASVPPPDALAAGRLVFENNCISCHRADGRGASATVPALAGNDAVTAREPDNVVTAVLEGFDPQGSWGAMPSFAGLLDDAQIAALANYVRNAWGNRGGLVATTDSVAALRATAELPAGGIRQGLLCPSLPRERLLPALHLGSAAYREAAHDAAPRQRLIQGYLKARPRAAPAEIIEALSTGYCRTLTADGASSARLSAGVIDFSQLLARDLVPTPMATRHPAAQAQSTAARVNR
jgi:mono/diheme cytochrome c family protein